MSAPEAHSTPSAEALAPLQPKTRVIALIDVDSFECQVWQRMFPSENYFGVACVVADKGGRLVSVTHEAKALGITRDMRLKQAKQTAGKNQLKVFVKPNDREKPDGKTTRYAHWEILDSIKYYVRMMENIVIEAAGSDEFYLDLTDEIDLRMENQGVFPLKGFEDKTFLEGGTAKLSGKQLEHHAMRTYRTINNDDSDLLEEQKLLYGAILMQEINHFIFRETRFVASVGVGTNKLLAKLAVSLNKPNGITILPCKGFHRLSKDISIEKIQGLGGKTGTQVKEKFKITTIKQLMDINFEDLEELLGSEERAVTVVLKANGISEDPVVEKVMNFEVSCGKNFYGGEIKNDIKLKYHIKCLCDEMFNERLDEELVRHKREPQCVRVQVVYAEDKDEIILTEEERMVEDEEGSVKSGTSSWSYIIDNLTGKTHLDIFDEIVEQFVTDVTLPITSIKISRICLTARRLTVITSEAAAATT